MKTTHVTYRILGVSILLIISSACMRSTSQESLSVPSNSKLGKQASIAEAKYGSLVNAYQGIEVRWFFKEEPSEITEWFRKPNSENVDEEADRTDFYLRTGYNKMSYKIRGGKTEIKVLDESMGKKQWGVNREGLIEKWNKWGPSLKNKDSKLADVFYDTSLFQMVKKTRLLVKYEVADNKSIRILPAGERVKNGCQVELTKITTGGIEVFSFAFESFGEEPALKESFDLVTALVFEELPGVRLPVKTSYGYPAFLAKDLNDLTDF